MKLVDPREVNDADVVEPPEDGENCIFDEDRIEIGCDGPVDDELLPLLGITNVVLVIVGFGAEMLDGENVRDEEELAPPVPEADAKPLEDVVKLETGVARLELRSVFEYIRIALVPPQFSDGELPHGYVAAALAVAALFTMLLPQ